MKKFLTGMGLVLILVALYSCMVSMYITNKYVVSPVMTYKQDLTQSAEDYVATTMESVDIPSMPAPVNMLVNRYYYRLHARADSYIGIAAVCIGIIFGVLLFLWNILAILLYTVLMHWLVKKVTKHKFMLTLCINTCLVLMFNLLSLFAEFELGVIAKFLIMMAINLCFISSKAQHPKKRIKKSL